MAKNKEPVEENKGKKRGKKTEYVYKPNKRKGNQSEDFIQPETEDVQKLMASFDKTIKTRSNGQMTKSSESVASTEITKSIEPANPTEITKSSELDNPTEKAKSSELDNPNETNESSELDNPNETNESSELGNSSNTNESSELGNSSKTNESRELDKSNEIKILQEIIVKQQSSIDNLIKQQLKIQKLVESQTELINKVNPSLSIPESNSSSDLLTRVPFNAGNQNSGLTISKYRLNKLMLLKKPTEFVLQAITAVFSVPQIYRRNLKGGVPKVKSVSNQCLSKRKIAFNEDLLEKFQNDLISFFPNHTQQDLRTITRSKLLIKLNQINNHFFGLISGKEEPLKEYDIIGFEDYDKYKEDISLFSNLDNQIEIELNKKVVEKKEAILYVDDTQLVDPEAAKSLLEGIVNHQSDN